jgi:hypothetical protein
MANVTLKGILHALANKKVQFDRSNERARAHRGKLWLELKVPDYKEYVDCDNLELADGGWCVLGQIEYGKYNGRRWGAFIRMCERLHLTGAQASYLGFLNLGNIGNYYELTSAWKQELACPAQAGDIKQEGEAA